MYVLVLQQCLPFTVLKQPEYKLEDTDILDKLQQCLPFTVLKLDIESVVVKVRPRCNSAYRLRY